MRKTFFMAVAMVAGIAAPLAGNALSLPESADTPVQATSLPQRGASKASVMQGFGLPQQQHAPVGGGQPQHPPITRWDYPGYSVFFEHDKVIDVVVKDRPAAVHHMDELQTQP